MAESKVCLTIMLPGSVMNTEEYCAKNKEYDSQTMTIDVKTYDKKHRKTTVIKDRITVNTRTSVPAKQSLKISKEAYDFMTSVMGRPESSSIKIGKAEWNNWNRVQRLEAHLNIIAESLGGKVFSYEIFDD